MPWDIYLNPQNKKSLTAESKCEGLLNQSVKFINTHYCSIIHTYSTKYIVHLQSKKIHYQVQATLYEPLALT